MGWGTAGVGNAHQHPSSVAGFTRQRDVSAAIGELHGIAQEIEHNLMHFFAVGTRREQRSTIDEIERQFLGQYLRRRECLARCQHVIKLDIFNRIPHDTSIHPGVAEHTVDQAEQVSLAPPDALEVGALLRCYRPAYAKFDEFCVATNGVERGAQLVTDDREEVALCPVRRLRVGARASFVLNVGIRSNPGHNCTSIVAFGNGARQVPAILASRLSAELVNNVTNPIPQL